MALVNWLVAHFFGQNKNGVELKNALILEKLRVNAVNGRAKSPLSLSPNNSNNNNDRNFNLLSSTSGDDGSDSANYIEKYIHDSPSSPKMDIKYN